MKIKKLLSFFTAISVMLSCISFSANAEVSGSEGFTDDVAASFDTIVQKLNWSESSSASVVENYRGKTDSDYSLRIDEVGTDTVNETGIIIKNPTDDTSYPTDNNYYIQALVYFPETADTSLKITSGFGYTMGSASSNASAVQFLHPGGFTHKNLDATSGGVYFQTGWNLISAHFNRDSATQYRLRMYVNGTAGYINNKIAIDEGSSLKDIYMKLELCDKTGSQTAINGYFVVDDVVMGKGVDVNSYWSSLNEKLTSNTYTVSADTAVISKVPDTQIVSDLKSNLAGGDISVVVIDEEGYTTPADDSDTLSDDMSVVFITTGGKLNIYSVKTVPSVGGIVIPEEDFEEGEYDSLGWNAQGALAGYSDGSTIFATESGSVTVGDNTSPYNVGGFWHFDFANTPELTVTKKELDNRAFYNLKSGKAGSSLTIRGQGADLNESKMTRGKYTVVEFSYMPSANDYFNMNLRWKNPEGTQTTAALFGEYATNCITFAEGGIYIAGYNGSFDATQAVKIANAKPGELYDVMLVYEIGGQSNNEINIKSVIINGVTLAEDLIFTSKKTGITQLLEVDMYLANSGLFDSLLADVKCYTTDEFMYAPSAANTSSRIELDGKRFTVLDYFEDSEEFLVVTEDYYTEAKFDGEPSRNHETLAQGIFNPEEETNIAYKLNNEYISYLPEGIADYINPHTWTCDSADALEDMQTEASLSLLSISEAKRYGAKIGITDDESGYWWLRSRAEDSVNDVYAVSASNPKMIIKRKAHGKMLVRPAFYMSRDLFQNVKLDYIGSDVAQIVENFTDRDTLLGLYTDEELNTYFERPQAEITAIQGKTLVGETLTAVYEYDSKYEEADVEFQWYESDTEDGSYTPINGAKGKSYTLTLAQTGKFIKVSVLPYSVSSINPEGEETISDFCTTIVFDSEMVGLMLEDINDEPADSLKSKLEEYNSFNNLDLSHDPAVMTPAMEILAQEVITSESDLVTKYNASIALAKLNMASGDDAADKFADEALLVNMDIFGRMSQERKDSVLADIDAQTFVTHTAFAKYVNELFAITEFSGASREEIFNLLKDYKDIFTASYDDMSDYRLKLAAAELEGTYTAFSQLDTAVTDAIAVANGASTSENNTVTDGKPTGSKGSGSGKGGFSVGGYVQQTVVPQQSSYNDLQNVAWAVPMIEALTQRGIVCGTGSGSFLPSNNVKREEFIKMITLAFDISGSSDKSFADVVPGAWYEEYISKAAGASIVSGYDNGNFGIGEDITREDLAVIIYRCIKGKYTTDNSPVTFTDEASISPYAREALDELSALGIISGSGDGTVDPQGKATRAMAAKMLYTAMEVTNN